MSPFNFQTATLNIPITAGFATKFIEREEVCTSIKYY